jgi:hypothetical protein
VVNRPGASSIIGMQACAKAAPDGYTVCMTIGDSVVYNLRRALARGPARSLPDQLLSVLRTSGVADHLERGKEKIVSQFLGGRR